MNIGQLIVTLGVDTLGLKRAESEMQKFSNTMQSHINTINNRFVKWGGQLYTFGIRFAMYVTGPLTAFGVASFRAAKDFEANMHRIIGLVGESRGQVASWSKEILSIGPALGQMPKDMARAMYFITSSGIAGSQAMEVLEQSGKAAAAGLGDVMEVADLVTSAMNAYRKEGLSAARTLDIFTAAIREGKTEAGPFAREIGQVIPIAAEMGVSLSEVAAAMASMSLTGTNAAEAATYLKGMINSLLSPSQQQIDAFSRMRTSAEELRNLMRTDFLAAFRKIYELTQQYGQDLIGEAIPNIRAMTGFLSLMGERYEENVQIFRDVFNSTGDLNRAFQAVSDTIEYRYNKSLAELQAMWIKMGLGLKETILPLLETLANTLKMVGDWFAGLDMPIRNLIAKFALGVAAIGPFALSLSFLFKFVIPTLINAFYFLRAAIIAVNAAFIATPIGLLILGVVSLIGYMRSLTKATRDAAAAQREYEQSIIIREKEERKALLNRAVEEANALKESMNNAKAMSKEQLAMLAERIRQQLMMESSLTRAIQDEIDDRLKSDREAQALKLAENQSLAKDFWKIAQDTKKREDSIINSVKAKYSDLFRYMEKSLKEVNELIENYIKPDVSAIDPAIKEIMDAMEKSEIGIRNTAKVMSSLGKEYDEGERLARLYTGALEQLAPYLSEIGLTGAAAAAAIENIANRLKAVEDPASALDKVMDRLRGELEFISSMGKLGWGVEKVSLENLNAFTQALEDAARKGYITGEAVEYLKRNIDELSHTVTVTNGINKQLVDSLSDAEYMGGLLGTQYDVASDRVNKYANAIMNLRKEMRDDNRNMVEKEALLKKYTDQLKIALIWQKNYNDQVTIANSMASGTVQMLEMIGSALGKTEGAWTSLVDVMLSTIQRVIGALLEQALATIFLASATVAEKEIARRGLLGLITAAVGISALMAIMANAKNQSAAAAKMKTGGVVPAGYPHDTYPAMLTSGETILPPKDLAKRKYALDLSKSGEWRFRGRDIYWAWKKHQIFLEETT